MFRIRQVTVLDSPRGLADLLEVKRLLRERLPGVSEEDIESLPKKLVDPLSARFRGILFLAEEPARGQRRGFGMMTHASDQRIAFLDYLVTRGLETGGVGAALYERVREEAKALHADGLFFECLPDDPAALCPHHPLWSATRMSPARFRRRDYGDARTGSLGERVRDELAPLLGRRPAGEVRMLTQVRRWGWLFNPITVYLVWDADPQLPVGAVLEVTNTPWKERHR